MDDDPLLEVPQHVQQQQLAELLQKEKENSDSVTWVPELIPQFVQKAVQAVLLLEADDAASEPRPSQAADAATSPTTSSQLDDPAAAAGATSSQQPPATQQQPPALALGSTHLRVRSSTGSKRPVDWVMTVCLVPEGLPTAAAAEQTGGLAVMEVVCRLLMLKDCQPAEASAAFVKAISKVKWQQYGLQYSDFFNCDDNTGILTLTVLPETVMVPLSMIVCCCNVLEPPQDAADSDPVPDQGQALDPTQSQALNTPAAAAPSSKRRRGGGGSSSRPPPKPQTLSMRREVPLWVAAFDAALSGLKQQLPEGYLRGKLETVLAASLPPVAASLANIMMRAANPQLRQQSCSLLGCEPGDLEEKLLVQLQHAAADALAARAAGGTDQQEQQQQQQRQMLGTQGQGGEGQAAAGDAQLGSEDAAAAAAAAAGTAALVPPGDESLEEGEEEGAAEGAEMEEQEEANAQRQWEQQPASGQQWLSQQPPWGRPPALGGAGGRTISGSLPVGALQHVQQQRWFAQGGSDVGLHGGWGGGGGEAAQPALDAAWPYPPAGSAPPPPLSAWGQRHQAAAAVAGGTDGGGELGVQAGSRRRRVSGSAAASLF